MGLSRNGTNRAACVFFRALAWCESSQAQKNVQPQVEPVVRKFDRPHQGKDTATATDHTLLRCWHTPLTAQSPLQLISHFVPCALSSSKIIKTYHIYIIFTYCIRTASRPSHVQVVKPSGMLRPFLHKPQAGIPALNASVSDLPQSIPASSADSALPLQQSKPQHIRHSRRVRLASKALRLWHDT